MSGIYIHIPFCKQACHYCNFHFSTSLKLKEALIAALVKEIHLTSITPSPHSMVAGKAICKTIYFGGGTPSILEPRDLSLIFDALHSKFSIGDDVEITLEANPDDISPGKLYSWKKAGINRLSVGIQSFLEGELLWMNRAHTVADSLRCIDEIKDAGFSDYSIDLIYGSPLLSNEDWMYNVTTVIKKNIPHVSCYALTVEPKTALDKMIARHKKAPVNEDVQAEQFMLLMDRMDQSGYEHYEISNFAKPGMRSKHNSSYWQGKNYYGFGPSAHAYDGISRRWNIANNALYIRSLQNNCIPFEEELLTKTQRLNEYIMTSLRTMEGMDLEKVKKEFGEKYSEALAVNSDKYTKTHKLQNIDSKLILTKDGKLFADGIAAELFF
ncbi:MAG: radical SAM family heme chaperone HemW [Ferruginibacter sp.]